MQSHHLRQTPLDNAKGDAVIHMLKKKEMEQLGLRSRVVNFFKFASAAAIGALLLPPLCVFALVRCERLGERAGIWVGACQFFANMPPVAFLPTDRLLDEALHVAVGRGKQRRRFALFAIAFLLYPFVFIMGTLLAVGPEGPGAEIAVGCGLGLLLVLLPGLYLLAIWRGRKVKDYLHVAAPTLTVRATWENAAAILNVVVNIWQLL